MADKVKKDAKIMKTTRGLFRPRVFSVRPPVLDTWQVFSLEVYFMSFAN